MYMYIRTVPALIFRKPVLSAAAAAASEVTRSTRRLASNPFSTTKAVAGTMPMVLRYALKEVCSLTVRKVESI